MKKIAAIVFAEIFFIFLFISVKAFLTTFLLDSPPFGFRFA